MDGNRIEKRIKKRVTDWGDAVIRATGGGEPEIDPSLLEKPPLKLVGRNGNAFMVLGLALRAARRAVWSQEQIDEYKNKATSGDYDHLLGVTMEYFDVQYVTPDSRQPGPPSRRPFVFLGVPSPQEYLMSDSKEQRLPALRQEGWENDRAAVEGTFALGRLFATPGAIRAVVVAGDDLFGYLARHARGDWGEVDNEDWRANDHALIGGTRLLSAYRLCDGTRVWIITEADRQATTILLPDEY